MFNKYSCRMADSCFLDFPSIYHYFASKMWVMDSTLLGTSVYDKLPGGGGLTTELCREGCKHIYYEPVPLPDELPESQKFTTIEDYFDAYQTIFVRNFQSAFISSSGAASIEWDKYGINTLGQKLIFAN